jgi:hypothetical protein
MISVHWLRFGLVFAGSGSAWEAEVASAASNCYRFLLLEAVRQALEASG